MLQALRQNTGRKSVVRTCTFDSPVEGWDASSALASMPKLRAIQLKNWFPQPGYVEVRRGYQLHCRAASVATPIESLMPWTGLTTQKLFGAGGGSLYDVTTSSANADITGLTEDRWQWTNFSNAGANYLYIVNGADSARHYNGTAWATPSITASGITSADFININVHKKRIWFVQKESTKAWYLATDAISGTATSFELGSLFGLGGYLVAMGTWTRDGGLGPDDFAVFISSRGQCAVYQGTDPATANTWELVGVYDLPAPIGRRCFCKMGGDLLLLTVAGVLKLSVALREGKEQLSASLVSERINPAMNAAARLYKDNFGWDMTVYPKGTRLVVNIPTAELSTGSQYVMNTLTGAWCEFDNHNAVCWTVWRDRLFFGAGNGAVYEADQTCVDVLDPIVATGQTAYQAHFSPGSLKRYSMVQPLVLTSGTARPSVAVSTDFSEATQLSTPSGAIAATARWDEAVWDTAVWGGGSAYVNDWTSSTGLGRWASVKFQGVTGVNASGAIWGDSQWGIDEWGQSNIADEQMQVNGFVGLAEVGGAI
jgi:hypothetical protein